MNQGQLTFPFKRYQVQPVWRADRPQKGRYREFYQCDADVVGSNSLLNEVELANIYATVFDQLKIPVEIKINSRRILMALAELSAGTDKMMDITVVIDKLDKVGLEKVKQELVQRGLTSREVSIVENYLSISGTNEEKIVKAKELLGNTDAEKKELTNWKQSSNIHSPLTSHYSPSTSRSPAALIITPELFSRSRQRMSRSAALAVVDAMMISLVYLVCRISRCRNFFWR
jgi:histidyl-tRNA synthetase